MKVSVEKPGSPTDILEHHGKKGMKWGVRNAYVQSVRTRAARQRRVSKGQGSKADKLRTHLTTSAASIDRGRNAKGRTRGIKGAFKGGARARAISSEQHAKRMENGKATVFDIVRMAGTIKVSDIVKGSRKN